MAEVQAHALYTFDGDTESGELTFKEGETLTIIQQDVGDGWWEARNYVGDVGLIPQAYVEIIEPPEPSFPPPPPPMPSAPPPSHNGWGHDDGDGVIQSQQSVDTWDEDWDDDDDDESSTSTGGAPSTTSQSQIELQGQGNFGLSQARPKRDSYASSPPNTGYGTVKKSFNRFSQFAKAGGEAYMMGNFTGTVSDADLITIIETADGPQWKPPDQPYTCAVRSPKKESKLKGLKSYIAYQITPSFHIDGFSNIQVSRRYKHFDWLHIQLENKFTCIPIPPLPDKSLSGRYEEEFIDQRMKLLQFWVDRICRHPVLSKSDVFLHFLTCTDDKKWKQGKRSAEKDAYTGGKFFRILQTPPVAMQNGEVDLKIYESSEFKIYKSTEELHQREVNTFKIMLTSAKETQLFHITPCKKFIIESVWEAQMESFCKFQKNMEENVKILSAVAFDHRKKHLGPFKREFQKIGTAFKAVAGTFTLDKGSYSQQLTGAMDHTGDIYNEIGDLYEKQPRNDLEPLMDTLNEYRGILGQFPDVIKVHEGAIGKARECVKQQAEGKMQESFVQGVTQRADTISFGTMAEINHFQTSRCVDFKDAMTTFLRGQIEFYREITSKLETALQHVEQS